MVAYTMIVADHSNAGIYQWTGVGSALRKTGEVVNPTGHRHERDLGSDAPGRVMGWNGVRQAFAPRHSLQQHAAETFVRTVIAAADMPSPGRQVAEVLLVAAPGLRGVFRRLIPRSWHVTVLPCNLAKVPATALRERIARFVNAPPERPRREWFGAA